MTEEEIKLQARLAAIEYLIGVALSYSHVTARHTAEQVRELHEQILENLRTQSLFSGNDPAVLDVASDEVAQNVERLLRGVETLLVSTPRR